MVYLLEKFDFSFTDNCEEIARVEGSFKLCASDGPMLFAGQLVLLSVYTLIFFTVVFCTRFNKISPETTAEPIEENHEDAHVSIDELVQNERWAVSDRPLRQ